MSTSEPVSFRARAREFVELHDQVETSVGLLDTLETFLSTFQNDLSSVSGQISDLQARSKDIENRLKSRKRIEKPLSNLISELTLPPPLVAAILDTNVSEAWLTPISDLETRLEALNSRARVRAARDLGDVAEGVRIVATTKLRAFFLAHLAPIRQSMTTNLPVLHGAVLTKYHPLYVFLQRQSPAVATEIQRAYVAAARTYYETGFRRYMRSLGYVKARTIEKDASIASHLESGAPPSIDLTRLGFAQMEGAGVTLMLMADNKTYTEPVESLLRSALLVLMDNTTAEYAFLESFFSPPPPITRPQSQPPATPGSALFSPTLGAPTDFDDGASAAGTDYLEHTPRASAHPGPPLTHQRTKEDVAALAALWKSIFDPALDNTQTFIKAALEPVPPVVPLLTMIRLVEGVMAETQKRGCAPLENILFGVRLQMWPLFQRAMGDMADALKKLAEGAGGGGYLSFGSRPKLTDSNVLLICKRYVVLFMSFVILTEQNEETMIFSNLLRLRQELTKLIETHTEKLGDASAKARAQSRLYEELLQGLNKEFRPAPAHPRADIELKYWRDKEAEARTRVRR
ncbi:vacuolar sorting protein [Peniophora sp. CONT]|nr:vacuolar sorting protein [Peniophora sp. CONT]